MCKRSAQNMSFFPLTKLGNCDIDYFIFRKPFWIMCLKFPKFERVWNVAEKFQKLKKRKLKIMK
jgi:hypothetical protein